MKQKKSDGFLSAQRSKGSLTCPKCGDGEPMAILCESCYLEEHPLLRGFKDLEMNICVICNLYQIKGRWTKARSLEKAVALLAEGKLKFNPDAKIADVATTLKMPKYKTGPGVRAKGLVEVAVKGKVHKKQKRNATETYELPLTLNYTVCTQCSRSGTKYYEGILQVRSTVQAPHDYVQKEVSRTKGVFITNTKELKQGVDYYLTSTKFMLELGRKLFARFGGDHKITRKLYSRSKLTGKNIYRTTFLFKLPDIKVGDLVEVNNKLIYVDSIRGKKIFGMNVMRGKPSVADYKANGYEIVATKDMIEEVVVSKVYPHIEILHPETYDSVRVVNKREVKQGDHVAIAIIDDKVYIVN